MLCSECSAPVLPVVVLDLDGTLGDYHGHFIHFACAWLGWQEFKAVQLQRTFDGRLDMAAHLGIDKGTYRTIKLAYRQGGMKRNMPEFEGARDLWRGLRGLPCEIWIATTRPYMRLDNVDPDTRECLRRWGMEPDQLLYDDDKYQLVAQRVDGGRVVACLEDLPNMYDRAHSLGLRPILRHTPYNRHHRRSNQAQDLQQAFRVIKQRVEEF